MFLEIDGEAYHRVYTVPQLTTQPHAFRDENKSEAVFGGEREWLEAQRAGEKRYEKSWEPSENSTGETVDLSPAPTDYVKDFTEALREVEACPEKFRELT